MIKEMKGGKKNKMGKEYGMPAFLPAGDDDEHKYDEYSVQCALDTIKRAEEYKSDEKMMAKLEPLMNKEMNTLAALRSKIQDKFNKDAEEEKATQE